VVGLFVGQTLREMEQVYVFISFNGPGGKQDQDESLFTKVQPVYPPLPNRQGGTVSQTFAWKAWRGVPWERASMQHVWGDSLVSGWGPFEFIDMCTALGIEPIITLAYDLNKAQDWADLVEDCFGDASTRWGAVRIHNDSHPEPYHVTIFELGNEQENPDFVNQVVAMEKKRLMVGAPKFGYMYPTNEGVSPETARQLLGAGIDPASIMPDCHVGGGGGISCAKSDFARNPTFLQSFINCETNAGLSTMQRALQEAGDLQEWFNYGMNGENPSRLIARTASFCSERSGHYDAFDQGLSFFLPNMTWLQPPGFVHSMLKRTLYPNGLYFVADKSVYQISSQLADDGKSVAVQIVNSSPSKGQITIFLDRFNPSGEVVVQTLDNQDLNDGNRAGDPTRISPVLSTVPWPSSGGLILPLAGNSFTVVFARTE